MFTFVSNIISKVKEEVAAGKKWAIYVGGVAKAVIHGGAASLGATVSASMLDNSKFNLTNGLKSEFDMLFMVFLFSGGLAGYLYVKANKPPVA